MRNFSQEHCGENKKEFVQVITFLRIERGKKEREGEEGWGGGGLLLLFAQKGDEYSKNQTWKSCLNISVNGASSWLVHLA